MEFGQDASLFWRLTYREIDTILRGETRRLRREHNNAAWLAWHTAYLTAYAPSKARRFPKLEKLLWKEPPKRQSVAEMRAVARRWIEAVRRRNERQRSTDKPPEKEDGEG